jgi:hypothetical protein
MTSSVVENPISPQVVRGRDYLLTRNPGLSSLLVRECVPARYFPDRAMPLRTAYVTTPKQALELPWIEKLPGEKRIRFVHGQIFVIQHYVGCRLIRAHICHEEERWPGFLDDTECGLQPQERIDVDHSS